MEESLEKEVPAEVVPKKKKRSRGRPKGSKTESIRMGVVALRCPKCGSSERGAYFGSVVRSKASGMFNDQPFNQIVTRRARCKCGQVRIERSYELI